MKYLYLLPIFVFILSGCAQSAPSTAPDVVHATLDQFVTFNSDGYATLRGRIGGGSQCPGKDGLPITIFMALKVPIYLKDISTELNIPFSITLATQIRSAIVPETTSRDFFIANPDLSFTEAFRPGETVEVTFSKQDNQFVAFAVRQVEPVDAAQSPIIESDILNATELKITSYEVNMPHPSDGIDAFEWIVAYPTYLHGTEIQVLLPIKVSNDVKFVSINGQVSSIPYREIEQYRSPNLPYSAIIQFKHKTGILEAVRITEGK